MKRRYLAGAGLLVIAGTLVLAQTPQTLASWTDSEHTTGSFTAGSLSPPTNLHCTAGLLTNVTFTWSAPTSGLPPSEYTWTATGVISDDGSTTTTSATLQSGPLTLGTAAFSLVATVGGWTSTPVTGTVHVLGALGIPLSTSCSVP
jgi:predicted ribosomally synthesized peptide with SipW-like signal peptide